MCCSSAERNFSELSDCQNDFVTVSCSNLGNRDSCLQAPVVAHGNDLVYRDTNKARALVNARGTDYQNHWLMILILSCPPSSLLPVFDTRAEY